jgi:hypothetical protein
MKAIALIVTTALLLGTVPASFANGADANKAVDLTGTWVLCKDQDHSPKDTMKFFEEGYGFELRPNKPKVPFLYKVAGTQVLLALNASGNMLTLYLSLNSAATKLTLTDQRTGHVAFYVRSGQEKHFGCTAK